MNPKLLSIIPTELFFIELENLFVKKDKQKRLIIKITRQVAILATSSFVIIILVKVEKKSAEK